MAKPKLAPIRNLREFDDAIAQLGDELREWIELEVASFATDPAASAERRERAVMDYQFFCQTYFPHYVPTPYFSLFQQFIFKRFPECIDGPKDAREVHEAPRGEAKSTYETQLGTLWCICRANYLAGRGLPAKARKHMIGIVMNTEEQSTEMLASIKAELEANPRLAQDFPDAVGQGRVWQATTVITANNIKIRIGGTGKKMRGMKHGPHRPDLIFLDDLENDENVRDKGQREKVQNFVLAAIVGLAGPGGGMDIFWPGTSLHYDAAINRVSRKPGWRRRVFRSITTWPDRMDLWDTWEGMYTSAATGTDEEKEQAEADALAFYQANKAEMERGAVVSWPEVRPLYRLMCMRAVDHTAFNQEQQNEAGNDEDAPFKTIQFWVNRLPEWLFFGAIDPSMGKKNKARDPSAILVGGLNPKTSILDVVEADIVRAGHLRERWWCVAANADGLRKLREEGKRADHRGWLGYGAGEARDPHIQGFQRESRQGHGKPWREKFVTASATEQAADNLRHRLQIAVQRGGLSPADAAAVEAAARHTGAYDWSPPDAGLCRVVDGVANRMDRIKCVGNGQVPLQAAAAWLALIQ